MIDFDEELKKFKPSLEIQDTEKAIMEESQSDVVDMLMEVLNERRDRR